MPTSEPEQIRQSEICEVDSKAVSRGGLKWIRAEADEHSDIQDREVTDACGLKQSGVVPALIEDDYEESRDQDF